MMQNKKIAITGGIGSGKTFVCGLLKARGFCVFSCDEISRALWKSAEYRALLVQEFPDCASGGDIDKPRLTAKVFSDESARERLNALSHPLIMKKLISLMDAVNGASFAEVPLLFEGGYEGLFDAVIAVRRSRVERVRAVSSRDGMSEREISARMAAQFPAERLEEKSCYILENTDVEQIGARLDEILKKIGLQT